MTLFFLPYLLLVAFVVVWVATNPTHPLLLDEKKSLTSRVYWLGFTPLLPPILAVVLALVLFFTGFFQINLALSGHLFWSSLGSKLYTLFLPLGVTILLILRKSFEMSRSSSHDLIVFQSLLFVFAPLLFICNTLLSFIFIIELLSLLVFVLILLWDSASRAVKHSWVSTPSLTPMTSPLPFQALFFFFWTSFVVTLLLFLSLNSLITLYGSADWGLLDVVISFSHSSLSEWSWVYLLTIFIVAIFIKSALAPFFFWKPIFFSALFIPSLLTYIIYFYPLFFIWFVSWWFTINPLVSSFIFLPITILLGLGFILTISLLSLPYKLRNLLAVSSIFNTLLIWFTLNPLI